MGDFHSAGRLGDCRFKTTACNFWLEHTGALRLHTGAGRLTAGTIDGDADISTGTGKVQLGEVDGSLVVKNSNGGTEIDSAPATSGRARRMARSPSSGRAPARREDLKRQHPARRSDSRFRRPRHREGDLDVGIAEGTAAWVEVNTAFGQVRNLLDTAGQPSRDRRGQSRCGAVPPSATSRFDVPDRALRMAALLDRVAAVDRQRCPSTNDDSSEHSQSAAAAISSASAMRPIGCRSTTCFSSAGSSPIQSLTICERAVPGQIALTRTPASRVQRRGSGEADDPVLAET